MNHIDVAVIFVLFNPSEEDIIHVGKVASLYKGVIVDNSPCRSVVSVEAWRMRYIHMRENVGIATAQNIGMKCALEDKAVEYVLFVDQDSRFGLDYPAKMQEEYEKVRAKYSNLAILGPTVIDRRSGEIQDSFIHSHGYDEIGFSKQRDLISSGSIVSRGCISALKDMMGRLFIDYVDFEWCWRAQDAGMLCGITSKICIYHEVGEGCLKFGKYKVFLSSPKRYYYQFRNHIWLCGLGYVPLEWKINNAIKHFLRLLYFPFVKNGLKCWTNMLYGIWHGIVPPLSVRQMKEVDSFHEEKE